MDTPSVIEMDISEDIREELERAIERVEWEELDSMLEGAINDLLNPTTPPPPPSFPARPPTYPQPAADSPPAFVQHAPQMTAPPTTEPAQLYSQPVTVSQGQCNNIVQIPDSMLQYLCPVGVLNGVFVCDFTLSAPPLYTPTPKKRKRQDEQEEQYIKKPLNAFMMFLKQQRPKVKAEIKINGSAAVNVVVGQRWKSLSKDQQATYYEQADQQRKLHAQKHPHWSSKDNYECPK